MTDPKPPLQKLFISFFRLGLTAFGGPAMVAHIGRMAVEKHKWLDEATFRSGVALCQMIPGATAIQSAAYVGLRSRGLPGAAASFIGFGLPAFFFMLVLSELYERMHGLPAAVPAFSGLRAVVVAIVVHAALTFGENWIKDWRGGLVAATATVLFWFKVHPIGVVLLAALCGAIFQSRQEVSVKPQKTGINYSRAFFLSIILFSLGVLAVLFFYKRPLFDLAFLMIRVDLFAFGGGFSALPLMFNEVVLARSWMDAPTFINGIALGQITPGPIVITATFIGYMLYGMGGSLIATVFIFLPSFLMVVATAPYYERLRSLRYFDRALQGVLYSFVGLLVSVALHFAVGIAWDVNRMILCIGAFIALQIHVEIYWIVLAGVIASYFFL